MTAPRFTLLSELSVNTDFVDDPLFTDVTDDGETYTLYRIARFTHSIEGHPDGWTHMANVSLEREIGLGVALLRVVNRQIEESSVTRTRPAG